MFAYNYTYNQSKPQKCIPLKYTRYTVYMHVVTIILYNYVKFKQGVPTVD